MKIQIEPQNVVPPELKFKIRSKMELKFLPVELAKAKPRFLISSKKGLANIMSKNALK